MHRVSSSYLQKAYLIKIGLESPSMTRMVFDSMTLESGYVTSRQYGKLLTTAVFQTIALAHVALKGNVASTVIS